ncbi:hypothetical protein WHX56_14055 [Achromobacter veterisilvae]|uniref:Uncharacterized protein n=1 Tax=Achromobacter veterisilvae TaxID=2069367 RepID=A0ABZ2S8I2_9BURK
MDAQLKGHLDALTFALGKQIRAACKTEDARVEESERLRGFADSLLQAARANSSNPPALDPQQQEYLSAFHETTDKLIDNIRGPSAPGKRS